VIDQQVGGCFEAGEISSVARGGGGQVGGACPEWSLQLDAPLDRHLLAVLPLQLHLLCHRVLHTPPISMRWQRATFLPGKLPWTVKNFTKNGVAS
jgi:hypothetical protein